MLVSGYCNCSVVSDVCYQKWNCICLTCIRPPPLLGSLKPMYLRPIHNTQYTTVVYIFEMLVHQTTTVTVITYQNHVQYKEPPQPPDNTCKTTVHYILIFCSITAGIYIWNKTTIGNKISHFFVRVLSFTNLLTCRHRDIPRNLTIISKYLNTLKPHTLPFLFNVYYDTFFLLLEVAFKSMWIYFRY